MWLKKEIFSNWGRFPPPHYSGYFPFISGIRLLGTIWTLQCYIPPGNFPRGPTAAATNVSRHRFLRHHPPISHETLCTGHLHFTAQTPHFFFPPSLRKPHLRFLSFLFVLHYFCFSLECSLWKCEQTAQKPICMVWGCVSNIKKVILRIDCKIALQSHYPWIYCS